jgi:hypothetical protein
MSGHNAAFELGQDQEGVNFEGKLLSFWSTTPTAGASGYGKGALAVNTGSGILYINTGTFASATWNPIS